MITLNDLIEEYNTPGNVKSLEDWFKYVTKQMAKEIMVEEQTGICICKEIECICNSWNECREQLQQNINQFLTN